MVATVSDNQPDAVGSESTQIKESVPAVVADEVI
jgi:hypothetical protein